MGSGKSTVGKLIAAKTGKAYLDLDTLIEKDAGLSIAEIFSAHGEIWFRKKEMEVLSKTLNDNPDIVLALGGGTPCFGNNMEEILSHSDKVFYLKASVETLTARLANEKEQRPMISHLGEEELDDFVRKHLFERNFFYLRSPHVIGVDQRSPEDIAQQITEILN